MQRSLALMAAVALLGAAPPANYNAFGISVLARLAPSARNSNVFISPVSLGVALAMAADGAAGETRAQMLRVLQANGTNLADANAALIASLEANHDARVGIANAVWTRQDIPPRPGYVWLLSSKYRARAQDLHFGDPSAAAAINAWTKEHTLGLIDHLVDSTSPLDFLYLTNALAFQADWSTPFAASATSPQPFTNADGSTHTVQMMTRSGEYDLATLSSYRMLRMPYGGGGYAAYVLLPNGASASALVAALSAASFAHAASTMQSTYVRLSLPRFTAEYGTSLNQVLEAMGMRDAFGSAADFSGMTSQRVRIASVVHRAYVRVDEKGTTAAAATSVGMTLLAMHANPVPFVVDKPFVLVLRDEHSGAILFIGIINAV